MDAYEKKVKPTYLKDVATWREDSRFESSAAGRLWTVHNNFRGEALEILRAKKKPSKRAFDDLLKDIHKHHKGEDTSIFPKMKKKFQIDEKKMKTLEDQHVEMLRLEDQARKLFDEVDDDDGLLWELKQTLDALFGHFMSHLALEEQTLMPHLLSVKSFTDMKTWPV